ncbi:MAG TPA: site-specific integrase [Dehalococcoidia bacterium]|nr:site-specific integrase [Dehalococcoidia bacterium]
MGKRSVRPDGSVAIEGKNANGEGSIFQRKDGRWVGSVILAGDRRKDVYGKTRQDVAAKRLALLRAKAENVPVPQEKTAVAAFLAGWLEHTARPRVRRSTYTGYEVVIRRHLTPQLGTLRLARLTPVDLSRCYATLQNGGLAARTVRLCHAVLHRALADAARWGLVARNVAELVDPPRSSHLEPRVLTIEEARQLMDAAKSDRLEALYVLALLSGLRAGELLGLRWADVDLDRGELTVRQQLQRAKGEWITSEPKTARGRRTLGLPARAVAALRRRRTHQTEERLAAGPAWQDTDLIFTTAIGTPIERGNILRRSFWPLLEQAGLPRIRFHDLRHTAATILLADGENVKAVQERLGHAAAAMTLDVYGHVLPGFQRAVAERLDRLFGS